MLVLESTEGTKRIKKIKLQVHQLEISFIVILKYFFCVCVHSFPYVCIQILSY